MTDRFSGSSTGRSIYDLPCSCSHEQEAHISEGDGMLPLCIFCGCTGWRPVPSWIQRIKDGTSKRD